MIGGMTNPPKAPRPPTHPAAPPTALDTYLGTNLKTPALTTPIPVEITTIPKNANGNKPSVANIMIMAPTRMMRKPPKTVRSPVILSARFPEYTLTSEPMMTKMALKISAMARAIPNKSMLELILRPKNDTEAPSAKKYEFQ